MKQKEPSTVFDPSADVPDFRAPLVDLRPPEMAPFPSFPTVDEILNHAKVPHPLIALSEVPPPRPAASLFESFFGGDLARLLEDAEKNPERYGPRETELLERLRAEGSTQGLGRQELALLDSAVLDYSAVRPPKDQSPVKPVTPRAPAPAKADDEVEFFHDIVDGKAPPEDLPDEVAGHWWEE